MVPVSYRIKVGPIPGPVRRRGSQWRDVEQAVGRADEKAAPNISVWAFGQQRAWQARRGASDHYGQQSSDEVDRQRFSAPGRSTEMATSERTLTCRRRAT